MTQPEPVRVFDSQGEDYKRAFQVFLDHTDQKRNAKRVLQRLGDGLPARKVFIDAGAGNGDVTRAFAGAFDRTIAIEPNAYLLTQLQRAIPQADAIGTAILAASPETQGDFVLCSHTLYYIPAEEWLAHLERLVSWMSPTGVTVVVLQNRGTACMTMLEHFFGHRFDLGGLADAFRATHGDRYDVTTTLDPRPMWRLQSAPQPTPSPNSCSISCRSAGLLPGATWKPMSQNISPHPTAPIASQSIKTFSISVRGGEPPMCRSAICLTLLNEQRVEIPEAVVRQPIEDAGA